MSIILISLATITVVHSAHVTVSITNTDDHRSVIPVIRVNPVHRTSNGFQLVPSYVYSRNYDGLVLSDFLYPRHAVNSNRRGDTQYGYQYKDGQWVLGPITEATISNNDNRRNSETSQNNYVRRQTNEKNPTISKDNDKLNSTVNATRHISKQSHDVKGGKNTSNPITNKETVDKATNRHNKPIFEINHNKTEQSSTVYHNSVNTNKTKDNANNSTKTNMSFNTNNKTTSTNNNTDISSKNKSKTTQDNEVTTTYEARTEAGEDDRWIWSNGEVETTTTLKPLDDRAAFDGNNCPTGYVRLNNSCVAPD